MVRLDVAQCAGLNRRRSRTPSRQTEKRQRRNGIHRDADDAQSAHASDLHIRQHIEQHMQQNDQPRRQLLHGDLHPHDGQHQIGVRLDARIEAHRVHQQIDLDARMDAHRNAELRLQHDLETVPGGVRLEAIDAGQQRRIGAIEVRIRDGGGNVCENDRERADRERVDLCAI